MMASVPAYNAYANDVLKPGMDPDALTEIEAFEAAGDFENPRYVELLMEQHYVQHVLRMPLEDWDRTADLASIEVPTLISGSVSIRLTPDGPSC